MTSSPLRSRVPGAPRLPAFLAASAGSLTLLVAVTGCSGPASTGPDAGGSDAPIAPGTDAPIAPGTDAPIAPGTDAPIAPGTDGGGTCTPTGGTATGGGYCDLFELAIFTSDDGAPEARLYGRLTPDGMTPGGCAVIDEVEVLGGGGSLGTLPGAGAFYAGAESALLARGAPLPEMTMRCADDETRFGGFGLLVRGRVDGGTFEAHCADAEGGSRWPPALRITCHHGVVERPTATYGSVTDTAMFDSTSVSTYLPHPGAPGADAIDDTIHVIPGFASAAFGPPPPMLDPFDAAPFGTSVFESTLPGTSTPVTQIMLTAYEVLFPLEICPPPSTGPPMPGDPLPPVFLARITGTNAGGAFSTEAYVNNCYTSPR